MQRKLLGLLTAACLALGPAVAAAKGAAAGQRETEPFKRLSVGALAAKMAEAKAGKLSLYLYDNNSREMYQDGHIPGARWVKHDEVKAKDLPADKGATLVFYCANEH